MTSKPESIRSRYAATLIAQFFQMGVSLVVAGIVPRVLGPASYGNYTFLVGASNTLRSFLEPSVQQAFFTFSAQDRESGALSKLYSLFLIGQFIVILFVIGMSAVAGITHWFWPGQQLDQIVLLTAMEWMMFLALSLRQLGDSKGLTVRSQVINVLASLVTLVGLASLTVFKALNLYTYALLNLSAALVACVSLSYYLLSRNRTLCWNGNLTGHTKEYLIRWWSYAAPLIALEYYLPLVAYISTYLIQLWYGSSEQGYFGLALRWSGLVMIFSTSAIMIVWREIASAIAAGDQAWAAKVFVRFNGALFFLAMVLSTALAVGSPTLVLTIAGEQYRAAIPVMVLMAFYPLNQTLGQISVASLKAAGRTRHYRNLGLLLSIPDVLITYMLLAPPTAAIPGLGWGAMGVAVRMVVYGLLSVLVYEWTNYRFYNQDYGTALIGKFQAVALIGIAALVYWGLQSMQVQWGVMPIIALVAAAPVYLGLIGIGVWFAPGLIGMNREQLLFNAGVVRRKAWALIGRE